MTSKYVFDTTSGLVKIVERKGKYYVYRLKDLEVYPKRGHSFLSGEHIFKFKWETTASETHGYKPYDEGDVSSSPDVYISDVRRWHPYKVRLMF